MRTAVKRVDERTRRALGGPGLAVVVAVVVVGLVVPVLVTMSGLSSYAAALLLFAGALVVAVGVARVKRGRSYATALAVSGAAGVALTLVVGATGIGSFSDNYRWSGLSAVAGITVSCTLIGIFLRRRNQELTT